MWPLPGGGSLFIFAKEDKLKEVAKKIASKLA